MSMGRTILLILLFITSCGGTTETKPCRTPEEALILCQAEYIGEGMTLKTAYNICEPRYRYGGCY